MKRKKNKHVMEIVVVLLIFTVMAVANALSSADFTDSVERKIAQAEARFAVREAEKRADAK